MANFKYKTELVKPVFAKNPKFDWQVANVDIVVDDMIKYLQSIREDAINRSNGWANFQITKSPDKKDDSGRPKLAFARVTREEDTPVSANTHMPDRVETSDNGLPF
jgi:hypothetical protein